MSIFFSIIFNKYIRVFCIEIEIQIYYSYILITTDYFFLINLSIFFIEILPNVSFFLYYFFNIKYLSSN